MVDYVLKLMLASVAGLVVLICFVAALKLLAIA
jgi:hypothetical protein